MRQYNSQKNLLKHRMIKKRLFKKLEKLLDKKKKITGLMYLTKQIVAAQLLNRLKKQSMTTTLKLERFLKTKS